MDKNKFNILFNYQDNQLYKSIQLSVENITLLEENETGKLFVRTIFCNLNSKILKAVSIRIKCFDVSGNLVDDTITYNYLDLKIGNNQKFGHNTPITIDNTETRRVEIIVDKVMYEDNEIVFSDNVIETIHKELNIEKKNKTKKTPKVLIAIVISIIVLIISIIAFIVISIVYLEPKERYDKATTLLNNKEYDQAYEIFNKLGDFNDSKEMLIEVSYQKMCDLMADYVNYYEVTSMRDSLVEYKDTEALYEQYKYDYACYLQSDNKYHDAYLLFIDMNENDKAKDCLIKWMDYLLSREDVFSSVEFSNTKISDANYNVILENVEQFLIKQSNIGSWCKVVANILSTLPTDNNQASQYINLMNDCYVLVFENSYYPEDEVTALFNMREYLYFKFVKNTLIKDKYIKEFLKGAWSSNDGKYYFNLDEDFRASYNIPFQKQPDGTSHYDIKNQIFAIYDKNNNELAKMYKFTILDKDSIIVHSYFDGAKYLLYR